LEQFAYVGEGGDSNPDEPASGLHRGGVPLGYAGVLGTNNNERA